MIYNNRGKFQYYNKDKWNDFDFNKGGGIIDIESLPHIGTPLPTDSDTIVEKVYFNTSMSIEDTNKILKSLTYTDIEGIGGYVAFVSEQLSIVAMYYSQMDIYVILGMIGGNSAPIYVSKEIEESGETIPAGWDPLGIINDFGNPYILDTPSTNLGELDGIKVGNDNEILSDIISIKPFNDKPSEVKIDPKSLYRLPDGTLYQVSPVTNRLEPIIPISSNSESIMYTIKDSYLVMMYMLGCCSSLAHENGRPFAEAIIDLSDTSDNYKKIKEEAESILQAILNNSVLFVNAIFTNTDTNEEGSIIFKVENISQSGFALSSVNSTLVYGCFGIGTIQYIRDTNTLKMRDVLVDAGLHSVYNINTIDGKQIQEKLVSSTNIKTINGETLLGSGDIEIQGGGDYTLIGYEEGTFPIEKGTVDSGVNSGKTSYIKLSCSESFVATKTSFSSCSSYRIVLYMITSDDIALERTIELLDIEKGIFDSEPNMVSIEGYGIYNRGSYYEGMQMSRSTVQVSFAYNGTTFFIPPIIYFLQVEGETMSSLPTVTRVEIYAK